MYREAYHYRQILDTLFLYRLKPLELMLLSIHIASLLSYL